MDEWIPDEFGRRYEIENLNGVSYRDTPIPRRWHKCKPQTRGWIQFFTGIERCACGAVRLGGSRGSWDERNTRRKTNRKTGEGQ